MAAKAKPAKTTWGGRRAGAGAKPLTDERRLERAAGVAPGSTVIADGAAELIRIVGLPPRRLLLAGQKVLERTDGRWLADFCRVACRQTIGRWNGLPLDFYPEQQAFLDDALAFNDEGERLYGTAVWLIPRKNGKTTTVSGVTLGLTSPAEGEGKPLSILAAGSIGQAGPLFDQAVDFVRGSEMLNAVFLTSKTAIDCPSSGGQIKRVAGDGKLNHGLNPYLVAADELHAWTTPKQKENWAALTTADGARDDALFVVISTAGWDMESLLGIIVRQARQSPFLEERPEMGGGGFIVRDLEARLVVHCYAVGTATPLSDLDEFKRANPAPWRTPARIKLDLAKLTIDEPTKRRLYGNEWTSAKDVWISGDRWNACRSEMAIPDGSPVFLGIDAALSGDTTAVAWAWRNPEGKVVLRSRVWSANPGAAADVYLPGGRIDLELIEQYVVHELAVRYSIRALVYDPRYFDRSAQTLDRAGLLVVPFNQGSAPMADAYQAFFDAVTRDLTVVHNGDRVLAAHVAAAAGVKGERGWKLSKLKSTNKIDALVACVMAHYHAAMTDTGSRYNDREMLILG